MDLKKALALLVAEFQTNDVHYAIIGGFAIGALGIPRSTIDLNFLVPADSLHKIEAIMLALGYKKVFASENASQYVSPSQEMGEVDFLHAFRPISIKMLAEAETIPVFGNEARVKVLRAEDIIALKLQSINDNPARLAKDNSDIEELMKSRSLDWEILKTYFELFGLKIASSSLRLSMQENKKNLLFTDSINSDMEQMAKNRKTFSAKDGKYNAAAWLDFATQFNAYMGHARRPFTPITGKTFIL